MFINHVIVRTGMDANKRFTMTVACDKLWPENIYTKLASFSFEISDFKIRESFEKMIFFFVTLSGHFQSIMEKLILFF